MLDAGLGPQTVGAVAALGGAGAVLVEQHLACPEIQLPAALARQLSLADDGRETFGGIGVAVADGFAVPPAMMQTVFQNLLNKAILVSELVKKEGGNGVVFHDSPGDWAMQAVILNPGESIGMSGFDLKENQAAIFLSVGHDEKLNIDTWVEQDGGQTWSDTEPDGQPVVVVDAGPAKQVKLTVGLVSANEPTLATSLVLRTDQ